MIYYVNYFLWCLLMINSRSTHQSLSCFKMKWKEEEEEENTFFVFIMVIFWDDSSSVQGHYHHTSCHWHWNFVNSCQTLVYVEWYLIQIKYDFQPSKPQHITELMYPALHWTEWNKILFCTIKPLQLLFQCVAKLNNRPGNKCNHSISLKTSKLEASSNHWMSKTHTHKD